MKFFRQISLLLAGLSLVAIYAAHYSWPWAILIAAMGLFWHIKGHRSLWVASLGLALFWSMAIFGLMQGFPKELMLLGVVMALAAWDLTFWGARLIEADRVDNENIMTSRHIGRLAVVLLTGLGLGLLALNIRLELAFWWLFLLGIAGVIALSRALGALQRESD